LYKNKAWKEKIYWKFKKLNTMEDLMMEKLQLLKPENSDKYDLQYMKDAGYIKRNNAELDEILNKRKKKL